MTDEPIQPKTTFVKHSICLLGERISGLLDLWDDLKDKAMDLIGDICEPIESVGKSRGHIRALLLMFILGCAIFLIWYMPSISHVTSSQITVDQLPIPVWLFTCLVAGTCLCGLVPLLLRPSLCVLVGVPLTLFLLIIPAVTCLLWCLLVLLVEFSLWIPLSGAFLLIRTIQSWRGIFFTCPSRGCASRGWPGYVCPACGQVNDRLWPNLYGPLWHRCVQCDHRLPTLYLLGRKALQRCCASCRTALQARHFGQVPERLVAVVGGRNSGKTCYLNAATCHILNSDSKGDSTLIYGQIDDPEQESAFWHAGSSLGTELAKALLMHVKIGGRRCQLYLYDAPGEVFVFLSSMTRQHYLHLVEGFVLLVDPLSCEDTREQGQVLMGVVGSLIGTCSAAMTPDREGRFQKRVAVVIAKADMAAVVARIGDIRKGSVPSEECRRALLDWGVGHAVAALESHFASVQYFACSALGREAVVQPDDPCKGHGLLEPLHWVLQDGGQSKQTHLSRL